MLARKTNPGRRRALKALGAAAVAAGAGLAGGHEHSGSSAPEKAPAYQPVFFTPREYATMTAVVARIIPSDATPGAREAAVNEHVDWTVSQDARLQPVHREGLRWLDGVARKKYGAGYARLAPRRQDALLRLLDSIQEASPGNEPGVKFWKSIRRLAMDGFYSSRVGLKELGYSGNTFLLEFKGCTHPEHKSWPDQR